MSDDAAEGHGDTYVSTGERTPAVMNVRRFVINMKDLANVFAAGWSCDSKVEVLKPKWKIAL